MEEERKYYREAILMLKKFFKISKPTLNIKYLPTKDFKNSIEDYHSLIVPLNQNFNISGKFDLVIEENGSLSLIDFKTGKKEEDDSFQLKFYKLLAETKFKKPVKKTSYYFLRTGNIKEFNFKNKDNDEIKEEIIKKINKIKATKNFEARPKKLCKFCLFKTFCPKRKEVNQMIKDFKEDDYLEDLPF